VFEYGINDDDSLGVNIYSSKTRAWIFKEYEWGEGIVVSIYGKGVSVNGFMHMLEFTEIVVVDMEGKTWRKYKSHMVMQSPSMKLGVSCVYVLLIFIICINFQSGSLKTMVVIN